MGYHTSFGGTFEIEPSLEDKHRLYLEAFKDSRRQQYNVEKLQTIPDPYREAVGLPLGEDGEFFVNDSAAGSHWTITGLSLEPPPAIQELKAIKEGNRPPPNQPGLWCPWGVSDDGKELYCEDGKSYEYIEWVKYVVETFLEPWGYKLNGAVRWIGEDEDDRGRLTFHDGVLSVEHAHLEYETTETWEPEKKDGR